jgi:hypothetical protein
MPRLIASSASSEGVQWLTGRPESEGASQPSATICTICCAVKLAGAPARGSSASAFSINSARALSSPLASAASRAGATSSQRPRQYRTVFRLLSSSYATCSLLLLTLASSSILARLTSRWGLFCRRTICSRIALTRSLKSIGIALGPAMRSLFIQVQDMGRFHAPHPDYTTYRLNT